MTNAEITKTFNQFKPLMRSICNKYSYNYGIDISDLESECNYIFYRTLNSFDPSKAKFITHLTNNLEGNLYTRYNTKMKRDPLMHSMPLEEWFPTPKDPVEFNLADIINSLSWESQEIIKLIFNPPKDFCDIISEKDEKNSKGIYLNNIRKYLRSKGWVIPTIKRCFKEIKSVLQEV